LLAWGKATGVTWQGRDRWGVTTWRWRIENYLTGPPDEPDPQIWRTEIAILLAE